LLPNAEKGGLIIWHSLQQRLAEPS